MTALYDLVRTHQQDLLRDARQAHLRSCVQRPRRRPRRDRHGRA